MTVIFLGVKTDMIWLNDIAKIPILGGVFIFILMFVPAVLLSFLAQAVIPWLGNDMGFTKAMLILLPVWNLSLRIFNIKLYLLFAPSWILLGCIALIRGLIMLVNS